MKYKIVQTGEIEELEKAVSEMIQDGWTPQGGVAINEFQRDNEDTPTIWLAQAMIKPNQ